MTTKQKLDKFIEKEYRWIEREIKNNIAKNQMTDYADDLIQEMMIQLYNMKEEKVEQLLDNGKLKWYILSGAGMQLRSSTSPFYLKIRKHKMYARENGLEGSDKNMFETGAIYEEYEEELYTCFKYELENLHWYSKTILKEYWLEGHTLESLRIKYGISKRHLTKDINAAMKTIQENCNKCE